MGNKLELGNVMNNLQQSVGVARCAIIKNHVMITITSCAHNNYIKQSQQLHHVITITSCEQQLHHVITAITSCDHIGWCSYTGALAPPS